MADENTLLVEIELDDGSVKKGFIKLEKQAKDTSGKLGKAFAGRNLFKNLSSSLFSLKGAFAGLLGGLAVGKSLAVITRAAAKQEESVNALNTSLKLAGTFSEEASQSFQNLASSIQQNSTVGDETILQFGALARNFTQTNEEAEKLTKAAVELSAATGLSLEGSVKNLGKTFAGLTGELGESIPALRNLTAEQLKAGAALDFVLERFGGAAASKLQTFSGVIQATGNNFGDLLEGLGSAITSSPALIKVIGEVNKIIIEFGKTLKTIDGASFVDELIRDFVGFSIAVNELLVKPVEVAVNVISVALNVIRTGFQTFIAGISRLASKVASFVSPNSEAAQNMKLLAQSTQETLVDFATATKESFDSIADTSVADNIEVILDRIKVAANSATEGIKQVTETAAVAGEKAAEQTVSVGEGFSLFSEGFNEQVKTTAATAQESFKKIGRAAFTQIGQGVGRAFAAFGKAIANGENALQAFLDTLVAAMGQMAIQLGTQFILQGIAYTWAGLPNGPALIAAGAALAAFGGILSAVGGGGGDSATAGGAADGGAVSAGLPSELPEPQPTNQVTLNVAGDVLDSSDTALRISTLLQEELDRSGTSILQVT